MKNFVVAAFQGLPRERAIGSMMCLEVGQIKLDKYLDMELDLRHAPLIINESGCNANTMTVSTPREKLQDKLVSDGRKSPISEERRCNTRQICLHAFIFAPRQIRLCRNRVVVNSDFAGDPVSRKSTTGLGGSDW